MLNITLNVYVFVPLSYDRWRDQGVGSLIVQVPEVRNAQSDRRVGLARFGIADLLVSKEEGWTSKRGRPNHVIRLEDRPRPVANCIKELTSCSDLT